MALYLHQTSSAMLLLLDIGKSQGKSDFLRSGKSQIILYQVREFPNFCSKSGNLSVHHSKLCSFMARIIILQSENYLMVSEKAVSSGLVCVCFFFNSKFELWEVLYLFLQIASVLWWFYFSKIVELLDTVSISIF